jgi:hypothetical protein
MYFAILLSSHLTNQPTNPPTNRPTYSPTSWPTAQNSLTHWLTQWYVTYVAWAADGYSSGPNSLLSWNPKLQLHVHELSELVQCKPNLHITLVPLLHTSFF